MTLDAAYAACAHLARTHYENFPVASHLLPRRMRPHVAAVYAFARLADDIADEGDAPLDLRNARLDEWLTRLDAAVRGAGAAIASTVLDPAMAADRPRRLHRAWRDDARLRAAAGALSRTSSARSARTPP